MRQDLTDITLVLDRSGSMSSVRDDAIGGMNTFIEEQKKEPGSALFTLIQFDHEYEVVLDSVPIQDVGPQTMTPRGNTALLDALGRAIASKGQKLAAMPEADRPGLVIFVVQTDGEENFSRGYTADQVKAMIEKQQAEFAWKFIFLGADMASVTFARNIGIGRGSTAVYMASMPSAGMRTNSANVGRMRRSAFAGFSAGSISSDYSDEELEQAKGEE